MKRIHWLIVSMQALLVILLVVVSRIKAIPLGVRGEWEWLRISALPSPEGLLMAILAVVLYCGFAGLGLRAMGAKAVSRLREACWLAGLLAAAVVVQFFIPAGAPDEYDLTKWAYVNYFTPSTGYYKIAKEQAVSDPWRFLAEYPDWIQHQDSLHIGTHPPGLIAVHSFLLREMGRNAGTVELLVRWMPVSTAQGFRQLEKMDRRPIPRADQASLLLYSLLTLLACAGTAVPLYLLARSKLAAPSAWAAAAFWPLATAVNLFQPGADTAYPLLSTSALALTAWAARRLASGGRYPIALALAVMSGLVLAFGMIFTLAFLPVGLIVGLVIVLAPSLSLARKAALIVAVGAGFLSLTTLGWILTGANPVIVWSWNLKNHARFYVEYPRTYLAWLAINPIELAIAMGLPAAVWCAAGLLSPRSAPRVAWITLGVLLVMNLVGRNMGEVARLWMLFVPPLLTAAGAGLDRLGGGPKVLAISAALMGLQTLALENLIQVVYPV
jgi:hypothetical protein